MKIYITPEAYEMLEDLRTRLHPTFVRSASEVIDTAIRALHRRTRREQERTTAGHET